MWRVPVLQCTERRKCLPCSEFGGLFSYLLALRGRLAPGGLVLTEMPGGQQEDRWRLTSKPRCCSAAAAAASCYFSVALTCLFVSI